MHTYDYKNSIGCQRICLSAMANVNSAGLMFYGLSISQKLIIIILQQYLIYVLVTNIFSFIMFKYNDFNYS